jgi:hypothetical protein
MSQGLEKGPWAQKRRAERLKEKEAEGLRVPPKTK